jgi:hypothetical protein
MDTKFDAAAFAARIQAGEFDGHSGEALSKLTRDQLEQVAVILARTYRRRRVPDTAE